MSSATRPAPQPGQPQPTWPHGRARRPAAPVVLALLLAAIAGAVLPVPAALAFLVSLAPRRPLIATAARRRPAQRGRAGHDRREREALVHGDAATGQLADHSWLFYRLGKPAGVLQAIALLAAALKAGSA